MGGLQEAGWSQNDQLRRFRRSERPQPIRAGKGTRAGLAGCRAGAGRGARAGVEDTARLGCGTRTFVVL